MTVDQLNTMHELINELEAASNLLIRRTNGDQDPIWEKCYHLIAVAKKARASYRKWHKESRP